MKLQQHFAKSTRTRESTDADARMITDPLSARAPLNRRRNRQRLPTAARLCFCLRYPASFCQQRPCPLRRVALPVSEAEEEPALTEAMTPGDKAEFPQRVSWGGVLLACLAG